MSTIRYLWLGLLLALLAFGSVGCALFNDSRMDWLVERARGEVAGKSVV